MFSDEEGGNPFKLDINIKLLELLSFGEKETKNINGKNITISNEGLITNIKDKTALVFLGDVQDNG